MDYNSNCTHSKDDYCELIGLLLHHFSQSDNHYGEMVLESLTTGPAVSPRLMRTASRVDLMGA